MKTTFGLMLLASALVTAPAWADDATAGNRRAEVRQRIESYAVDQLVSQLQLDATAAARFREVAQRYHAQIDPLRADSGAAFRELKQLLASPAPDEARATQLTDRILSNRAKVQTLDQQRVQDYRRTLTPVQFARLVAAWPQLSHDIRGHIMRSMHGRRGGAQPGNAAPAPAPSN